MKYILPHLKKGVTSVLAILFLSANNLLAATINVPADQLTLDAAITSANPGDVIILAPGTYIQTNKIFIDKPLTISSQWYTTGDTQFINQTILDGVDKSNTLFETVYQQGVDFEISGLTIKRFDYPLIFNDSAVIQHNFMSNNGHDSISFEATGNGYVGFNTIEDARDDAIDVDSREGSFTIEFNTIRNCSDDGMEIRLFSSSQPGMVYDIHDNSFNGNDEDGIQLIDHTSDDSDRVFYIYNNVLDGNAMVGLGVMGEGNTTENFNGAAVLEKVFFYNNTVINNTVGVTGGDNFIALNNIIANNSNEGVKRFRLDSVIAHSIFYNNGTNITDAITGTGIILDVDPEYDPITYELSAGSPSIDKGVASYIHNGELVLDQNASEYIGSAPDLGAKELDNGVIAENLTPIVSAGIDQVIFAPNNSTSLEGEVNDDGLPLPQEAVTSFWTQDDGPGIVTFDDASHITTTASFSQQGIYHLRLSGDDSELTASDSMVIRYAKAGLGDTLSMLTPGSTFFEAEDYAYLYGAAAEISDVEASNNLVIKAQAGSETEAFTEHTLTVTEQEVTFYVWVLGKGFDENSDSVFVSFADSAEVEVILPSNNSYDWVKMPGSFDRTAGSWPLIVRTDELGATWDRLLFTTDPDFVPVLNQRPSVNAGADQTIILPETASLNGTVSDDGQPDETLSSIWNQINGPGTVTFNDPNNKNTIATFSLPGTYVLELAANDSLRQSSDQVTITVQPISKVFYSQDVRISSDTDDSEEFTSSGIADTTSSDLEIVNEGGPTKNQLIGLRFNNLSIPTGATITHAYIQFQTDEIDSIATSLNIQGEDTDNAVTFSSTNGDISNRPRTLASVTWNPTPWLTIGEAGAEQQTPDISTVIQQIVDRDGWLSSNSLAIIISGNGERTAEAFDGDPTAAAVLHLEYNVVNQHPTVIAGLNQTITLPDTASLNGTVTDDNLPIDGLSSVWSLVSGPGIVTFNDPNLESATATFSQAGTYVLELMGDDSLVQETDQLTITVKPVNIQPVVNAGLDQTIALPNTALLSGSVTDDNQPIATLTSSWTQVSGPGIVTFNDPNLESATATFSLPGTYVLELTGNDTLLQDTDQVTITVKPVNLQPVVNAGADQTITLPNTALLSGSVTDDNQPITTLTSSWTQVSGPGVITFNDPNLESATATFSLPGTYVLELTGNDTLLQDTDQVTITVKPVNLQPIVNAGTDQTITLPNTALLGGSVTDDNQPIATLTSSWTQISGPGVVTFNDPTLEGATATFSLPGTYVLELTGNDTLLQNTDQVTITVKPENLQPLVNAGLNQTITLPSTALLNGTVSDDNLPNGTLTNTWSLISGPGTVTYNDPNSASAIATFSQAGSYILEITANDGLLEASDQVTITVNPIVNIQPTVNAGPNQTITYPNNSVLNGTVSDDNQPNGTLSSTWNQVSGPGTVTFDDPNSEDTTATYSEAGTYELELTATDGSLQGSDQITVTVEPVNLQPTVNAGIDQSITLPNTEIILNGTITDDDLPNGTLTSTWSMVSGPDAVAFSNQSSTTATATFVQAGTYVLELVGDDSLLQNSDQVTITVNPVVNIQPSVNAGLDQTITLPNTALLNGTVTDDDQPNGSLSSIWRLVSGPGSVTFDNPNSETVTATFSQAGTYVLELTGDDSILQDFDQVTITVNPVVNIQPTVNAGLDQTITLPNTAILSGTVTDDNQPNGSLTTHWSKISGPGTVTFNNPNSKTTGATFSLAGTYVLELTGSDSLLEGSDQVRITVNQVQPINVKPTVNAGSDQTITLPNTDVVLNGTVTDDNLPNGTLTSTWVQVSGPETITFSDSNSESATAIFSLPGTYILELIGNDSQLQGSDQMTITVNPEVNQQPSVNAGQNQTITLPNTALLNGTITDDGLPNGTLTAFWSRVSGPGNVTFNTPNSGTTSASFSQAGTYVVKLTGNDSLLQVSDQITITVNPLAPQQMTLNSVAETYISENQNENFGGNNEFHNGLNIDNEMMKGLIKFDTSNIPAGATITSATLRLFTIVSKGLPTTGVYQILNTWNENTATWISMSRSGNFGSTQLAVTTPENGWTQWVLPNSLIQNWIDEVSRNNGVALQYEGSSIDTEAKFSSKENENSSWHPQLVIEYTP